MNSKFRARLNIRGVDLGFGIVAAPMSGITDSPVRTLAKRFGADMVCCEMIAAKGLAYVRRPSARARLLSLVSHSEEEKPFCVQLFGSEPETFSSAARMVVEAGAEVVDINAGCPVRKVVGTGAGAALMRQPDLLAKIIRATREAGDFPLTVKLRLGWDDESRNFVEVAQAAVEAGADAITLHARTRSRMFGGTADWDAIAELAEALPVPVIGNGDVNCAQDALRMLERTGCAGVMIGRAANGRPWIFRQIKAMLSGREVPPDPEPTQIHQLFAEHFALLVEEKGEYRALREIRKHLLWYTRGMPGAVALRRSLYTFKDTETVTDAAKRFFTNAQNKRDEHARAS